MNLEQFGLHWGNHYHPCHVCTQLSHGLPLMFGRGNKVYTDTTLRKRLVVLVKAGLLVKTFVPVSPHSSFSAVQL